MYRYVAMLWDAEDLTARDTAAQFAEKLRRSGQPWDCCLSADGMSVFALPPLDPAARLYSLPGEAGVVLGRLFRTDLSNPHLPPGYQVDEEVARQIARTAGQHLMQTFWGGYVAFLRDRDRDRGRGRGRVIRDCAGKIPCYYTQSNGLTLVFAEIGDLAPLGLPAFTVNWHYLAAFVAASQLQVRACAYNEVKEVLAGECLELRGSSPHQSVIWDPRQVCRQRWILEYPEAVARLSEVAQGCIDAWAKTSEPILHGLSGGFDSAVVLGCLHRSPSRPNITCLNYFAAAANDDERHYARLAAAQAAVPLLEHPMESTSGRLEQLVTGPTVPKPAVADLFRELEIDWVNSIAAASGARTLWTGQGGDHIFLQTADPSSAADYLATRGLRPGFAGAVCDAAHLSRQPYWFVLRSAFKSRKRSQPGPPTLIRSSWFVEPDALPKNPDDYLLHPWTADSEDLPPGKRMQIGLLGQVANRHRPIPGIEHAPQHHPLLSQPLMEVCLRIPTYLLVRGGRERSLARDAFSDRVPPEIIQRGDKGSVIAHAIQMIRQREPFVRELLLGGTLASARFIVRSQLEPFLVRRQPFREEHLLPLLACIAAEIWTRRRAAASTVAVVI